MDWRPAATRAALELRATLASRVRAFFSDRGLLEVDTPALSAYAPTDPNIESVPVELPVAGTRWLQTSPEFPMKRLLADGIGDCWQLCRVFRGGEAGRLHHPEFMMLEWYRVGWDDARLIDEVDALVRHVLKGIRVLGPTERVGYADAFERATGVAFADADAATCRVLVSEPDLELDPAQWHDLVMGRRVIPSLGRDGPCFITGFPAAQAALARLRDAHHAARFELVIDGVEVANGFHELTDPVEQRARFERDNAARKAADLPQMPLDENLLAAMAHGLPDCAGVALGFDRLVMLAAGARRISDVVAFGEG